MKWSVSSKPTTAFAIKRGASLNNLKSDFRGLSACTGKHCVFGHLGLVFIWRCVVFCLLFLLFYVISAPVPAKAADFRERELSDIIMIGRWEESKEFTQVHVGKTLWFCAMGHLQKGMHIRCIYIGLRS